MSSVQEILKNAFRNKGSYLDFAMLFRLTFGHRVFEKNKTFLYSFLEKP